jgi:Cu/Ag efflux protein CusF
VQEQPQAPLQAHSAPAATRRYRLAGTERLLVRHGAIPGFMGAMTMPYDAGKHEDLQKVAAGDEIETDVVVNATGTYLENIKVTGHTK